MRQQRSARAGGCCRHSPAATQKVDLDGVRAAALARIDLFAACIVESLFIVTFFLLADLSNRIHLLLLISIVSCYTIVVLGLVALGAHFNRGVVHQFEILTNYAVQYA